MFMKMKNDCLLIVKTQLNLGPQGHDTLTPLREMYIPYIHMDPLGTPSSKPDRFPEDVSLAANEASTETLERQGCSQVALQFSACNLASEGHSC